MIKKFTLCIVMLLTVTTMLSAQTLAQLDAKNGFRHFKLGSPPSAISNKISDSSFTDMVKEYKYTGNDITTLYGVKVKSISLSYYNNKLMAIRVVFGDAFDGPAFTENQFNSIENALENAYGTDHYNIRKSVDVIQGTKWLGKKVELEIIMHDTSQYGYVTGYLNVYDKNIMAQFNNSQF